MRIGNNVLVDELQGIVKENIKAINQFTPLNDADLNQKPSAEAWSILECIEHLLRYDNFYLPEISAALEGAHEKGKEHKTGVLGNYFANSMKVKPKLNKMKTFKSMNPINSKVDKKVLILFKENQEEMLKLLEQARSKNLTKLKTGMTLTKHLKFRLGDTFRFVIYHQERHIKQALRNTI